MFTFRASTLVCASLLLLLSVGHSQQMVVSSGKPQAEPVTGPHPYVYGGLELNSGGGYSPAAGSTGVGVDLEDSRFMALAEVSVANAEKQDSGNGYEVHAKSRLFLRNRGNWFYGGGAQWNRLATSTYSKQFIRPAVGGGKDIFRESFSMRAQLLYLLPGTDRLNALQGPEFSLWLPSPASARHFFYRQTVGIYEFHETSVPGNPGTNDRSVASFSELTLMYRF